MRRTTWVVAVACLLFAPMWLDAQETIPGPLHVVVPPPQLLTAEPPLDSVFLSRVQDGDRAWYTSQLTNYIRAVTLVGVSNAQECERREVQFIYLSNAPVNASPPVLTSRGQWISRTDTVGSPWKDLEDMLHEERLDSLRSQEERRDSLRMQESGPATARRHSCIAIAPWRLGDNPGRQYLRARLVRDTGAVVPDVAAERTHTLFSAVAHAPPAIIAGLALLKEPKQPDEDDEDQEKKSAVTIIGFDFPIVWGGFSAQAQKILSGVRPMIATGYADPGEDVYVGLELQPFITGPRGMVNPLQFTIGYGFQEGTDTPFFAIHYNTTALLQGFLGLF